MTMTDALLMIAIAEYLRIKGEYPSKEAIALARKRIDEDWIPKIK